MEFTRKCSPMTDKMTRDYPTKADVVPATADDLAVILRWLEAEYEADHQGFWDNRNIVAEALDEGRLHVIRRNGEAVAYQVGHHSPVIANVRKEYQHQGYGTALFEASLDRAYRDDIKVLSGECAPVTSLEFWRKRGFEQYEDPYQRGKVLVRRLIHRSYTLPEGTPRVRVVVSFFPEEAKYGDGVAPLVVYEMEGAVQSDGVIQLDRRALAATSQEPNRRDLVVRVEVDGDERCFDKAKYPEPEAVGILRDWESGAFYIDRVLPATAR